MAAGLQLKNQLTSKDETVKLKFQAKWLQLPEDIRTYVKKNVRYKIGCFTNVININFLSFNELIFVLSQPTLVTFIDIERTRH